MKKKFKSILMVITAVFSSVIFTCQIHAETYYLSNSGDDANNGLSENAPWQTIDKLNEEILPDNAAILFKRGDIFRGAIAANKFPTGITFGAYGSGDNPVICGSVRVSGWTPTSHPALSQEVYEADVSALPLTEQGIQHLFVNGELMTIARYPNVDNPGEKNWLKVGAGAGTDAFTDPVLAEYGKPDGYWNGATLRIRNYSWTYKVKQVKDYTASEGRITAEGLGNQLAEWGYFLDGKLEELDYPGEWYYDADAMKIYLYPPEGTDNLNNILVEASTYKIGIAIIYHEDNTTVENLNFRHFTDYAIKIVSSDNCIVRNCRMEYCTNGIYTWNTANLLISENSVENSLKNGISITGEKDFDVQNSVCEKNIIRNTAMFPCYGIRYDGVYQGIGISVFGKAYNVRQNNIENTSHAGINLKSGGYHIIENNIVRKSLLLLNDGGAIVIASDGNTIRGNFLLESLGNTDESNGCGNDKIPCMHHPSYGMGIGADSNFRDNVIEGNTIANNPDMGIRLNSFINTICRNNVVYNNDPQIAIEDKHGPSSNNIIEGNIIYSLSPDQKGITLTNETEHGTFDNNIYGNPYGEVVIVRDGIKYSLSSWQNAFPSYDRNSKAVHPGLPEYTVSVTGENQILNPGFDTDVSNWNDSGASTISFEPEKAEMDSGSLKAEYTGANNANVIPNVLKIIKDQWYRLKFSVIADGFGNIQLRVNRTSPEYEILEERFFAIDTGRKDYEFIFKAKESTDFCKILFITKEYDAKTYWLDNVSFEPVDAVPNDVQSQSMLFMNMTEDNKTLNSGCRDYLNLDAQELRNIILEPYSSEILIYKGSRCSLEKCIAILKLLSGADSSINLLLPDDDMDGDGKLGLGDCIAILQFLGDIS